MPQPNTMILLQRIKLRRWILPLLALSANLLVLSAPALVIRSIGIWVLAGFIPGLLAARLLFPDEDDELVKAVVAGGLGYATFIWIGLLLHDLPGPISTGLVLAAFDALTLILLILDRRRPSPLGKRSPARGQRVAIVVLVVIAAAFRLPSLGYSELQGDEALVLTKAAASIQGQDDVLFLHNKGPAEILLPTVTYAATRRVSEGVARFPFALANLLGILGLYAIGQRALSQRAGFVAALLIALNGFYVAFGRIAQYQSLVFLFSVLGLLCAWRFAERCDRRDLWLCALFLASGLLAHSDAVFAVMASALVVLHTFVARRSPWSTIAHWLWAPALAAGLLLATFYIPFLLHPHFQVAEEYLQERAGQPPYNNWNHFLVIGTVYNAIYYSALVAMGLVSVAVIRLGRMSKPRWLLPALFLALLALSFAYPRVWLVGKRDWVGLFFTLVVLVLLFARSEPLPWRAALVWFGLPFLAYVFWFRDPRTHLYILFPGAALLCGAAFDHLRMRLKRTAWAVEGLWTVALMLSSSYLYVAFIRHSPEYRQAYPASHSPLFWVPYGQQFPKQGLFGFPHQSGWKVVGYLYANGVLQGDYDSNEKPRISSWYTRNQFAGGSDPRYYFVARSVQDERPVPLDKIKEDYDLIGQARMGAQVTLWLYELKPARTPFRDYQVAEIARIYDQQLSHPDFDTGLISGDSSAEIQHPMHLRLGSAVEFLGYHLDKAQVHPAEAIVLTLYWRAIAPISESYTVFTHVEDAGIIWGQKDHPPDYPTDTWRAGAVVTDRYVLVLKRDTPAGNHALIAGMYRADNGQRLPVTDASGASLGNSLDLGTITVVPPLRLSPGGIGGAQRRCMASIPSDNSRVPVQ